MAYGVARRQTNVLRTGRPTLPEKFSKAGRDLGQRLRVQPVAPDPETRNGLGANDGFALPEFDKQFALPGIKTVRQGFGIQSPILLYSVLLVAQGMIE
jgi:hypothetical protein